MISTGWSLQDERRQGKRWSCQAWRADSAFIGAFRFTQNSKGEGLEVRVESGEYSKDHWRQEEKVLESSCLSSWDRRPGSYCRAACGGEEGWRCREADSSGKLVYLQAKDREILQTREGGRGAHHTIAPPAPVPSSCLACSMCLARTAGNKNRLFVFNSSSLCHPCDFSEPQVHHP